MWYFKDKNREDERVFLKPVVLKSNESFNEDYEAIIAETAVSVI